MRCITLVAVWVSGCFDAPVERPTTTITEVVDATFLTGARDQVDILFVIDKSDSMEKKQIELRARLPQFVRQIEAFADAGKKAHYHIGVVTSDLGANGVGDCLDLKARLVGCPALGLRYIEYDQRTGASNLPAGTDLTTAFGCMAQVGTGGCGYEQHLEAARRAVENPDNAGFIRKNALLAIVFVADEDDCSAPPDTDLYAGPVSSYGAFASFRCTQFGLACGDPPMSIPSGPSAFSSCDPAQNGKLYPIARYVDFFRRLKPDPEDVILASITGETAGGLRVVLARRGVVPLQPCSVYDPNTCVWTVEHACRSPLNPDWVGDPAFRIGAVVQALGGVQTSVCAESYVGALTQVGVRIEAGLKAGCLKAPLVNPDDPDCVVEDHVPDQGVQIIPACKHSEPPCWRPIENLECPEPHFGIAIDRVMPPPLGTETRVSCATMASRS